MSKKFSNNREVGLPSASADRAQAGFIKMVIIVIIALVLIKYIYDIDVVGFLTEGKFREILDKAYKLASDGWERYKDTLMAIWNYVVGLFKKS